MAQSRRKSAPSQQSTQSQQELAGQGAQVGPGVGNGATQKARSGGIMGWFRDAGQWVGDTAGAAVDTVSGWAEDTKDAARELWEAAASTDFEWKDGVITVETDLDQVMDLVPADLRAGLALDRNAADNRVAVRLDTNTHELIITSDALEIASYESESLSTGAVSLSGMRVVLSNHSGGLPFLGGDFSMLGFKEKDDNLAAQVTVASAIARDVQWRGEGGPLSVQSLALTALTGTLASGKALPGAEAASTDFGFDIEGAVLQGLKSEGHMAESVSVSGASVGMSQAGESAFLEADQVDVRNGALGTESLGSASASGVRVDVDNRGGGALFMDNKADKAKARVAVEAASISDFDGASTDLASGSIAGARASFDTTTGAGDAFAHDIQLGGLDSSWVDVNTLDLDDAGVRYGRSDAGSSVEMSARRAKTDGLAIDTPTKPEGPQQPGAPLDWSANFGAVDMTNTQAAGAGIASVTARGLRASGHADGLTSTYGAYADEAAITGLSHDLIRADGLSGTNTSLTGDAHSVGIGADHIKGSGISANNVAVGEVDGWGLDASVGQDAGALSLDRARMSDALLADRLSVASGSVDGLTASRADGQNTVSIDSAAVSGVADSVTGMRLGEATLHDARTLGTPDVSESTVGNASLRDLSAPGLGVGQADLSGAVMHRGADGMSGSVAEASATTLSLADRLAIDSASATGLSGSQMGGVTTAGLRSATATGLSDSVTGATLGGASLTDARGAGSAAAFDASLGNATVRDLNAPGVQVANAGVSGAALHRNTDGFSGSAASASAQDLTLADRAHIDAASLTGLSGSANDQGQTMGLASSSLTGVSDSVTGAKAGTVNGQGLSASRTGDGTFASATHLGATDLSSGAGASRGSASAVSLDGAGLSTGPQGSTAGAERVRAQGVHVHSAGGGSGGPAGLDTARLAETLAPRVQYADARIQSDIRAGELGGGLKARPGTGLDASVRVRNNQMVPGGSSARFSRPLDGPAWTGVNGISHQQDGRMMADVSGWFDQDVTGTLNKSLGLPGKRMPSVGQMGAGVANTMRQGNGGDGGMPLQNTRGSASVGLSGGTIDAGRAGGVTLDHAQRAGDNQIDARFGPDGMDLAVQRFLAKAARLDTGSSSVRTGAASASGVKASTDANGSQASVNDLDLRDLSVTTR